MAARLPGIAGTSLAGHQEQIRALLRLNPPGDDFAASASLSAEGITVELDIASAIDVGAEQRRRRRIWPQPGVRPSRAERKLANADFTAKAPRAR